MIDLLLIGAGLLLLLGAGEALVRGAVAIAARSGLSPTVIGLTVVGFGTSMPELVTSLYAALSGAPAIAIGNVVGSNIANILLILGVAAAISPLVLPTPIWRDLWAMIAASVALAVILLSDEVGRLAGGALFAGLLAYLFVTLRESRSKPLDAEVEALLDGVPSMTKASLMALAGVAGLSAGAALLVQGAVNLAEAFGVSQAVIGVTIVAIGTSLPELVASSVAAWRGQGGMAIGNVVGSNIFNILGILGLTALITPIPVDPAFARLDIWVMGGAALFLLALPAMGWKAGRSSGGLLLAGYATYMAVLL